MTVDTVVNKNDKKYEPSMPLEEALDQKFMDEFVRIVESKMDDSELTIDDIANKLCGETVVPGDLDEKEYSNLFVVKRKGLKYVFKRKQYGN